MGYCIDMQDSKFTIPVAKKAEGLRLIKELMKRAQTKGNGGSFAPGQEPVRWFSWVNTKAVLKCETLATAMEEWGYPVEVDDEGVTDIRFTGEKIGQEELLFAAIAPIVDEGSYIAMEGEDYDKWRWFFTKGTMVTQAGTVVYK